MTTDTSIADPHAELGVTPKASEREIKDAYRRLAARWHPDRNRQPRAAERMARINEAYRQLCETGAVWDETAAPEAGPKSEPPEPAARTGHAWWERDWGRARWEPDGAKAPRTIRREIEIALEQAAFGCRLELQGDSVDLCGVCAGAGTLVSPRSDCRACAGAGRQRPAGKTRWQTCGACRGDGAARKPCEACAGSGETAPRRYHLEVRLPAGVRDGHTAVLRGQGQRGPKEAGHIEIGLLVSPHPLFSFDNENHLCCRIPVDIYTALAEGAIDVPMLDGSLRRMDLAQGHVQVLPGLGFPDRQGVQGPLRVEAHIITPQPRDEAQRKALRGIAEAWRAAGYAGCDELAAWHAALRDRAAAKP